jgi:hypothetical protein
MKIQFQGGAVAEVSDEYGESLVASSPQWTVVEGPAPKPHRARKTAVKAVDPKPEGAAVATEE